MSVFLKRVVSCIEPGFRSSSGLDGDLAIRALRRQRVEGIVVEIRYPKRTVGGSTAWSSVGVYCNRQRIGSFDRTFRRQPVTAHPSYGDVEIGVAAGGGTWRVVVPFSEKSLVRVTAVPPPHRFPLAAELRATIIDLESGQATGEVTGKRTAP